LWFFCLILFVCFLLSTSVSHSQELPPEGQTAQTGAVGQEPPETIRVDADLVDLNVTILNRDRHRIVGQLEQKDFKILEDGSQQDITFFSSAETPFDLVLLIDLSGSTAEKIKLIRSTATSFVEATRPSDRVAIATFSDVIEIVSPMTMDRNDLKARIKKISKPKGGTNFWDSLRYVLETILSPERNVRRSAVVVMTDGVDNALPDVFGPGSTTEFNQLLAMVSKSDSIVIPIYLDTEREMVGNHFNYSALAYQIARKQLASIARESGGMAYYASKVEDLKDVYQQVVRDLSTVYSIGYLPTNKNRNGAWRLIDVELAGRPELIARTKRGYFAK
jgi:VWFA-related protein